MSSFKTLASNVVGRNTLTSATEVIPGRTDMAPNAGGGISFVVNDWTLLDRFLILGSEASTYAVGSQEKNKIGSGAISRLLKTDGIRVVDRIIEISQAGRARKNDYALFALAKSISEAPDEVKRYAGVALNLVARTGTHLMHFTAFAGDMRGWGKVLKTAIQDWYNRQSADDVAYQAVKYQSRDGWSQRDLLRLSHPNAGDDVKKNLTYRWIVKGLNATDELQQAPAIIQAFEEAKTADEKTLVKLIVDHRLSHEMIPNEMKSSPAVWEALAQHMKPEALIRNLNKMTAIGLIGPFSEFTKSVVTKLTDVAALKRARIHPLQALVAQKTYMQGHGTKGSLVWNPQIAIRDALEATFYSSFQAIEPSGLNMLLGLDVSASMGSNVLGIDNITCREAAAVMAMVSARTESNSQIFGFDHKFKDLKISPTDSLATVMSKTNTGSFGATNMSLPMALAEQQKWNIDGFIILTDNDINTGNQPVHQLRQYRKNMQKPNARFVAMAMQLNRISIADPTDFGMLDVVGLDTSAPAMISDFVAGRI